MNALASAIKRAAMRRGASVGDVPDPSELCRTREGAVMPASQNQVLALRRNSPDDDWRFAGFWIRANVPNGFFEEHPQGEYVIAPIEELSRFKITAPSALRALSFSEAREEAEPTMDLG